jgi:hypothetical protein
MSKGKIVFGVIGYGLIGLVFLSLILRALWQVKSGTDWAYSNYKNQPMTYLGFLASMAIAVVVGIIGLYYWLRTAIQRRRNRHAPKATE